MKTQYTNMGSTHPRSGCVPNHFAYANSLLIAAATSRLTKYVIMCLLVTATSTPLYGSPDCLDNSWHLQRRDDDKNYHPVECTCLCEKSRYNKISVNRGQCSECGHFGVRNSIELVPSKKIRTTE